MRARAAILAALLLFPTALALGPSGLAPPEVAGAVPLHAPGVEVAQALPAVPPVPCLPVDVPLVVDECGDTMTGDLAMQANVAMAPTFGVSFASGALRGDGALTFDGAAVCLADFAPPACGDITGVLAGAGLTGGAASGDAALAVDPAVVQSRVTGACAPGNYLRAISATGGVTCGADADTVYSGVAPITVSGATISLAGCAANQVRKWTGTAWGCAADQDTTYAAGSGLTLAGTVFSVNTATIQSRVTGVCAVGYMVSINAAGGVGCSTAGLCKVAVGVHAMSCGGDANTASGGASTVGGGGFNVASANYATVGGGISNTASDTTATVAGGSYNTASGYGAAIPGGVSNTASGQASFAGGHTARAIHAGSFVWADDRSVAFPSTADNQFSARATGGVRFVSAVDGAGNPTAGVSLPAGGGSWSTLSDREAKTGFGPVDPRDVLDRVAALPMTTWNYKTQPGVLHLGPMAQDFAAAFGLGEDARTISNVDADGVALAAIQGLHLELEEKEARIAGLEARIAALEARFALD